MNSKAHGDFYSEARLYDVAFDFKEYDSECEFMLAQFREHTGREAKSWLELAAGPARHSLDMARRGLLASALDLSGEMVAYGQNLAEEDGLTLDYSQGDMTDFQVDANVDAKVDLVGLMIDSICYVLTNEDLYRHFQCVSNALNDDGLYIIEMAHPKDVLTKESTAGTDWVVERAGLKVRTQWGADDDKFDPVTQITDVSVKYTVEEDGKVDEFTDSALQRTFTCTEFQALVKASGCFELVAQFGACDVEIGLGHDKAWRMISVLRKR